MRKSISNKIKKDTNVLEGNLTSLDNNLSDDIKKFYKNVEWSTQEIYMKVWILFSIDNIITIVNHDRKNNINTTDLWLRYMWLGHCKVAFYDPQTNMIYYRDDGGSNGFDRTENYTKLKNYKSDKKNIGLTFTRNKCRKRRKWKSILVIIFPSHLLKKLLLLNMAQFSWYIPVIL